MASRGGERQKSDNDMDTDDTDDDNDDDDRTTPTKKTTTEAYQVATPIDMYGMQAALLGRRSFGSFNPAIEEAWKESKASLELDSSLDRRNKQQATDEELIQRYQEIVKKRSESARTVGNLGEKSKPKKQIR
jgi:M-phase phosphoprotein 6